MRRGVLLRRLQCSIDRRRRLDQTPARAGLGVQCSQTARSARSKPGQMQRTPPPLQENVHEETETTYPG